MECQTIAANEAFCKHSLAHREFMLEWLQLPGSVEEAKFKTL